jgi:hypothetical protein
MVDIPSTIPTSEDPPHQGKVVIVGRPWRPVDTRARDAKQHAVPADRLRLVGATECSSTVRRAHLPDLRAKKIPLDRQLSNLGAQLLDLAFARCLTLLPDTRVKGPLQQLRLRRLAALRRSRPNTTKPAPGHKIYPYLLRNITIDRPNQVNIAGRST